MIIPNKIKNILETDQALDGLVKSVITSFEPILKGELFFFEEYTDHGIDHIEMVLKATEFLIHEDSFEYIQPKEVAIYILSVILHDIGMHTEFSTFKAMIDGKYDEAKEDILDKKTWQELWQDYLSEIKHWSSKKLEDVFGKSEDIDIINIITDVKSSIEKNGKDGLSGVHKKLIGEFIRKYHARLAHEIALIGFIGDETISFGNSNLEKRDKQLIGIIARSHGVNIRETFAYLKHIAQDAWQFPSGLNIVYLMIMLRIADYLQIDKNRTDKILLKIKTFISPLSLREHKTHLAIQHIHFGKIREPELIYVECNPQNAQMYVKIHDLIKDIQHEFDLSWAILGEIYGFNPNDRPKIKFRRIDSNLEGSFAETLNYVPKKIAFDVNNEVAKLLVAPLYGNNPIFGVRELVQNATDACKERVVIEKNKGNTDYEPLVIASIDKIDEENYLFRIKDNGKGMTLNEILNYFLSVGSSFREAVEWKKEFEGKVVRNGRFGIGVLATFLLGDEVAVKTKSYKDNTAYFFKAKINSEYIDIEKINNFDVGTEIDILISKNKFNSLEDKQFNKILWKDWYIGNIPKVQYLLNGENQSPREIFKPNRSREIYPNGYDKVQWDYSKEIKSSNDMIVVCNDIIITLENNNKFAYPYSSDVISYRPHLLIEDSIGNLPLSLNRNRIESYSLPFEEDLYQDVAKDFVAQLLTKPVSLETIKKNSVFPHNVDFLYSASGFSLALDYFTNKIKDKISLRILTRNNTEINNIYSILNKYPNLIISPLFSQLWNLRGQGDKVAPSVNSHILLKKRRYEEYFEEERRIRNWLINSHKQQWRNDEFVSYTMNGYQSKLNLFNESEFNAIVNSIDNDVQSIQEIPMGYLSIKKSGIILNHLFKQYIGDNVIIPYNIEERKRLYPLAFEELKDYMNERLQ